MKYLDKVLGIEVTYENVEFKHLPIYSHKVSLTDGGYEWTKGDFPLSEN